jgi:TusA-related sulfurtransferase
MHESPILIDARGLKCPRPIIELAKARRLHPPGRILEIRADDMAFESDVRAWCETTGNLLLSLAKEGECAVARIELR